MMSDFQDGKCLIVDDTEVNIRKLRYRLKRQGMLELDVWLSRLEPVLESHDEAIEAALAQLLICESVELLAMMQGDQPVPDVLLPWLGR